MKVIIVKGDIKIDIELPNETCNRLNLREDIQYDLNLRNGVITFTPIRRRKYILENLLNQINDSNLHNEILF